MLYNLLMNNQAELVGDLCLPFAYSHEVYGETFYYFYTSVPRLSNSVDRIVTTISQRLLDREYQSGERVHITGQFRSYNNYSGVGNKLMLTLFAKSITPAPNAAYANQVTLNGYICKPPVYRTTPFGREITDLLLAVNRSHNKSDYIPCIAWGRNAKFAQTLTVGSPLTITGRMQSREYQKKIGEEQSVTKTAYEISISKLSVGEPMEQQKITSI